MNTFVLRAKSNSNDKVEDRIDEWWLLWISDFPWDFVHQRAQNTDCARKTFEIWISLDLNDGKIFTTMEWLMVFVKVPL